MASFELFFALCLCLLASCSAKSGLRRELTTRSYDSLGFHENIHHSQNEDQIIIGVLDSGIWPESLSFKADGLGPPPSKWKGICDVGNSSIPFNCNNKIIGARFYPPNPNYFPKNDEYSPRDMHGHGSHCAATAAGVPVKNVSIHGVGLGTARGAVPRARIAVYKVCWGDLLCVGNTRAMIDALSDGVDILSISNGMNGGVQYNNNGEAITSYIAALSGVLVTYAAGNNSTLDAYTVSNIYPWTVTVANSAGSGTDYVTYVELGDGKRLEGIFLNTNDESGKSMYPLVRIEEVTKATDPELMSVCATAYIKPELVKGKIIICPHRSDTDWDWNYDHLGCAGVLLNGDPDKYYYGYFKDGLTIRMSTKATVTLLKKNDYEYLEQYYNKSKSAGQTATARVEKTVSAPDTPPRTILTSSRGPSLIDINILKPDVSAPGVNQIDAYTEPDGYKMLTGTSMSTPLIAGVAAYIKSLHPTWSASAIKSAIMTTATRVTDNLSYAGPLAYGSGQVSPVQAADPGLVYDIGEMEYVKYLCQHSNLNSEWVNKFTKRSVYDCASLLNETGWTLNYPSFAVPVVPNQPFVSVFKRTLTNVANSSISNYKVIVNAPRELTINVEPSVLAFTQVGQALSYTLTVSGKLDKTGKEITMPNLAATIVWTDGVHQVSSPISVYEKMDDYEAQFLKTHGFGSNVMTYY